MPQVQKAGHSEVVVDAPLDAVWRVVADVTRTGEWSHECREVHWLDGAGTAAPGARFRGCNRAGWARWGRICEILTVEEPREIAWRTVSTALFPDSSIWRIRLEPTGEATRIVQEFEVVHAPKVLDHLYATLIPRHQDRSARLTADLERIGTVALRPESAVASPERTVDRRGHRRLTRMGNRIGVWLFRKSDGRLASGRRDVTVLLLTVPGRRTGRPHSTCMRYLDLDDGWIVWGTGSGSRHDPDWFENLRAAKVATVQQGARVLRVVARELEGDERDRVWQEVILARAPQVQKYAIRAGRTIPVARLTPI